MRVKSAVCLVLSVFAALPTYAAYFAGIGIPPDHLDSSSAAISRDGQTVVGSASQYGGGEAFRWTTSEGMQVLGDLPGGSTYSNALGVSPDGAVVVGFGRTDAGQQGFRWDAVSGLRAFGSADHVYAVYGLYDETTHEFGVRPPLPSYGSPYRGFIDFSDSYWSEEYANLLPYALSDNKQYFAGARNRYEEGGGPYCTGPYYVYSPVRFTTSTYQLQVVSVAGPEGSARGISADGSVVVGHVSDPCEPYIMTYSHARAFRWVEGQGTQYLGTLPVPGWAGPADPSSAANAVSADGNIVVGFSDSSNGRRAFLWDPGNGMRDLANVLGGLGVAFPGWTLYTAAAISADGLTVTGSGTNPAGKTEAWIANLSPVPVSELAVTLSDNPDPVLAGQTLTYVAKVTNFGSSTANDVTLTSATPSNVAPVSAGTTQGNCSGTEQITCSLGSIAPGGSVEVILTVIPDSGGSVTYTVAVTSSSDDAISANNRATVNTTVEASAADLVLSIADSPDPVPAGHNLSYTATITNNGVRSATNVTFTSATPPNTSPVSASASLGSCNSSSTITCSLGTLDPGASATVNLVVKTYPSFAGVVTRIASVQSETFDANSENNTATVETTVEATADIAVGVSAPNPVLNGASFSYLVTVRNYGLATANDVVFTSPTPALITHVSASASQGSCSGSSTVTCNLGAIAGGAAATISIGAIANIPYSSNGASTYRILSVSTTATEATTDNNSVYGIVDIVPVFDLAFSINDQPDPVVAGQPLTYTVLITNNGPHNAGTVGFLMKADSSLTRISSSLSQGNCNLVSNENSWTCGLGAAGLAAGATARAVFVVTPNTTGSVASTVKLTSTGSTYDPDPVVENDTASATTAVIAPSADLALVLSDSPDPVVIGQPLTYTATVSNNGPVAATNTHFTSATPPGTTLVSVSASQGNCSSGTEVSCDLGELATGSSATISMVVVPQSEGTVTRSASVSSDVSDPMASNNSAIVETTVKVGADLALSMTDSPDPVKKGAKLVYTLTLTNNGPSGATNVTLTDVLPANTSFEKIYTSKGKCSGKATVTCAIDTLSSGESATVTITVKPFIVGTIANSASAASAVGDPNTANNSASVTTQVYR